jgi:hypothetical protein
VFTDSGFDNRSGYSEAEVCRLVRELGVQVYFLQVNNTGRLELPNSPYMYWMESVTSSPAGGGGYSGMGGFSR